MLSRTLLLEYTFILLSTHALIMVYADISMLLLHMETVGGINGQHNRTFLKPEECKRLVYLVVAKKPYIFEKKWKYI